MPKIINAATTGETKTRRAVRAISVLLAACAAGLFALAALAPAANAQGSRKDDIVFGTTGHPVSGATVRVCQAGATGTPCSPLATIYTDATMAVASANPFQTDGLGNYHFYAPAARYVVQITGPGITGTITNRDVILPADISSGLSGSDISAFGLTLGGNLTVAGNATISGTLTSSTFSPTTLAPGSLQVTGNGCFGGPRPYIDVTCPPYGARGDGTTDDTTAITNAINAACATTIGGSSAIPDVVFPPGRYNVDQTQGASTTPDLPSCAGLRIRGLGNGALMTFATPAQAYIGIVQGSNPSAAPVFAALNQPNPSMTFEDIAIDAYNQAIWANNAVGLTLTNTCLRVKTTGLADNTPLKLTNVFDFWMTKGCLETLNGSLTNGALPVSIWDGETNGSSAPNVYIARMQDVTLAGGAIQYIQRVSSSSCSVDWVFRNILREASASDFINISSVGGNTACMGEITIDHFQDSDTGNPAAAVINDSAPGLLSGVTINHAVGGANGNAGKAIVMSGTPGTQTLDHIFITGCEIFCAAGVYDGSGNPLGPAVAQNTNGFDFVVPTTDNSRLIANIYESERGAGARFTASGSRFASMALDPSLGVLFGTGAGYGWTAQVTQTAQETLDIGFSTMLPPTGVTATPVAGGTLANGTYYYFVASSFGGGSCANSFTGSTSLISAGATTTTGNNQVTIGWTLPPPTSQTLTGFCVFRSTTPTTFLIQTGLYVAGASTTTATDTGSNFGTVGSNVEFNHMQAFHRFTPTSLGVNTTNPQFNLDVNGSAAVNSLNGVQMAERFSGSDAAAKINACLTAASSSSGVCDAHGMTGTLTAATHIAIPAGTTLLWGQAQLTINDTTNNDAVELLGDGSSLVGYQESGAGTVPRADSSGFIACQPAGCTAVKNPNAATRNVDWVHITGMYLKATGAASIVLNLTSVGHADIENNRLVMGTGGTSYGIFGDTTTGGFDSTNTLIKHNEFDPQFQNDRCLHLAGIFNVIEMEQNTCILPAANTGTVCFELAKDSSGNYPNNDEFYGNDCEGSTTFVRPDRLQHHQRGQRHHRPQQPLRKCLQLLPISN